MGKKEKKKGKGAEKTTLKTDKKAALKIKKDLAAKGEEDIDCLLAKFVAEDKAKLAVTEDLVPPPSKRTAFSLTPHPDKDQLILFGGEYFNGNTTKMFNDLFFYTIKQNRWLKVSSPGGPPPRSGHQAVALSQSGGQLWIFGGEFTSHTQAQFYHFKDLWVFHFNSKRWEKITCVGGPSARSGHRMVVVKKQLIVFGGFHDNSRDYKYFNDVYAFNLEDYKWNKLNVTGNGPCPRSACQMVAMSDGRVLMYGGYSKEKIKKDADKGVTHSDMFILAPDKHDTLGIKWKWQTVKQSGVRPSPRCGFSLSLSSGDKAFLFGGVYDEVDEEEELEGVFYNDIYQLDIMKQMWHEVSVTGRKEASGEKRRRRKREDGDEEDSEVSVGPSQSSSASDKASRAEGDATEVFSPPPRINAGMAIKRGVLYLYGGMYEDGDKQLTLNDFYSLDLNKLEEWQTIIALEAADLEWYESDSEEDDDDMEDESEEEEEEEEEEENEVAMDTE
ncbi:kelch domain-containing protein 4 isoform X2 [Procambarus clarkii]|uniref:kelch domain-containing protein 4 isoform X2 n=1 Tax=Procambarus clarkii TaxID=6728 RepID=UPI003742C913